MVRSPRWFVFALTVVLGGVTSCAKDGGDEEAGSAATTTASATAATTSMDHSGAPSAPATSAATTDAPSTTGGPSTTTTTAPPPPPGPDLVQPEVIESVDRLLATTLDAKVSEVEVGGRRVSTLVFNGHFPAPTLHMRAGDDLHVRLVNNSDGATNLHTHGFHVSPMGFGDNVLHHLDPGGQPWDITIDTPDNLSPGLYWYHAHNHGDTEPQVTGGLAGAIIVEGPLDEVPGVAGLPEHVLMIQASQFDQSGQMVPVADQTTTSVTRFVNGQLNPVIRMRPGEVQRWRIANIQANDFMELSLDGHQLHQIAADANTFDEVVAQDSIVMAPANRVEVLVEGGQPGTYTLRAGSFAGSASAVLATLVVEGDAVPAAPLPTTLLPFEDLRQATVDNSRTITFSNHNANTGWAVIDGKAFDPNRVDQTIELGSLEEWTVRNDSDFWHPFHIHINDFQVVAIGGEPYEAHSWLDTVPLPPNSSVTFRIRFSEFPGKAVYHCHILNHEDLGMMAVFEVMPPD